MLKELSRLPVENIALINGTEGYSYGYFPFLAEQNKGLLNWIKGWNVAVQGDSAGLARMLPVLQGQVSSMMFLPDDLDDEKLSDYYQQASVRGVISLKGDKLSFSEVGSQTKQTEDQNIYQTKWIIPTSGTTGRPKLVAHSFESLTRTTKKDIQTGNQIRWGLTYDLTRFAGLQVYLQALLSGSTLLIPDSPQSFSRQIDFFVKAKCNAISATPSFWRKLLMYGDSEDLELRTITLGGEIAEQQVLDHLQQIFPKARIVHIYASTEAGVGFSVKDGHEGFPIEYLRHGVQNSHLKIGKDGILYIKPDQTNQYYIGKKTMFDGDGFINTGDLVHVEGDRVKFLGRASGAINIGGNKVVPEEIEKQLLASGLAKDAHVFGSRNSILGMIVKAEIVPAGAVSAENLLKKEILNFCRKNLDEAYKVPAVIKIVNEITRNSTGKLERKR